MIYDSHSDPERRFSKSYREALLSTKRIRLNTRSEVVSSSKSRISESNKSSDENIGGSNLRTPVAKRTRSKRKQLSNESKSTGGYGRPLKKRGKENHVDSCPTSLLSQNRFEVLAISMHKSPENASLSSSSGESEGDRLSKSAHITEARTDEESRQNLRDAPRGANNDNAPSGANKYFSAVSESDLAIADDEMPAMISVSSKRPIRRSARIRGIREKARKLNVLSEAGAHQRERTDKGKRTGRIGRYSRHAASSDCSKIPSTTSESNNVETLQNARNKNFRFNVPCESAHSHSEWPDRGAPGPPVASGLPMCSARR